MERREFVRKWGRLALLGGMAATAGYFALSGKVKATGTCPETAGCGACSTYALCRDPKRQKTDNHGK